jgi:hypothetical protein
MCLIFSITSSFTRLLSIKDLNLFDLLNKIIFHKFIANQGPESVSYDRLSHISVSEYNQFETILFSVEYFTYIKDQHFSLRVLKYHRRSNNEKKSTTPLEVIFMLCYFELNPLLNQIDNSKSQAFF